MEPITVESTNVEHINYASLGLAGNPFDLAADTPPSREAFGLVVEAMIHRVMAWFFKEAQGSGGGVLIVQKAADVPKSWHVTTTVRFLERATENESTRTLIVFVPLEMFRLGRIRGVLSATAERVAFMHFLDNLALYTAGALTSPDEGLPEWQVVADSVDTRELVERLEKEPVEVVQSIFGEATMDRARTPDPQKFMRLVGLRLERQEPDPAESDDTYEVDEQDPLGEVFTVPLAEVPRLRLDGTLAVEEAGEGLNDSDADPAPEGERPGDGAETEPMQVPEQEVADKVAAYIIAHMKQHLSPVLARGLRAYMAQGLGAMFSEWKITRAPKKTLKALARFACGHYERVVFVFDHFEQMALVPEDAQEMVWGTLPELRFALKDHGSICVLRTEGENPELDELFGTAERIDWDYPAGQRLRDEPDSWTLQDVQRWVEDATIPGRQPLDVAGSAVVKRLSELSGGDAGVFAKMMSIALRDAASRGVSEIDDEAAGVAIEAVLPRD